MTFAPAGSPEPPPPDLQIESLCTSSDATPELPSRIDEYAGFTGFADHLLRQCSVNAFARQLKQCTALPQHAPGAIPDH